MYEYFNKLADDMRLVQPRNQTEKAKFRAAVRKRITYWTKANL